MTQKLNSRRVLDLFFKSAMRERVPSRMLSLMLFADFGGDSGSLSAVDIEQALDGSCCLNWKDIAFATNEVLAGYSLGELNEDDQAKAICASVIYLEAIDHGFGDIEFCFWKIIEVLRRCREVIDVEFAICLTEQMLLRK